MLPPLAEFDRLDQAQAARVPGQFIWSREVARARRYLVGTCPELRAAYMAMPDRMGEEMFFAHDPVRLFYKMEDVPLTSIDEFVTDLKARTRKVLAELFGEEYRHCPCVELSSSTATKQTRHLFFAARFRNLAEVHKVVELVLPGNLYLGVNKRLYRGDRGSLCLPFLPSSAKKEPFQSAVPFEFEDALVNVVGQAAGNPLLEVPEQSRKKHKTGQGPPPKEVARSRLKPGRCSSRSTYAVGGWQLKHQNI